MKKTFCLLLFVLLMGGLPLLHAQTPTLVANYQIELKVPEALKKIEDESLREMAIKQFESNGGLYTMALQGNTYAFTKSSLSDGQLPVDGKFASYADLSTRECVSFEQIFDRTFLIKDSIRRYNWEISPQDTTILEQRCVKAIAYVERTRDLSSSDTLRPKPEELVAWFCPAIPAQVGPRTYTGLPGLILKLETSSAIYTLVGADFVSQPIQIEQPEGKRITKEKFAEIREKALSKYTKGKSGSVIVVGE